MPVVWLLTVAGSLVGVTAMALAGDAARSRILRARHIEVGARTGRIYRIWTRYGVPGWGLTSPLVFAPAMGTAIAIVLGAPRDRLWAWMCLGVMLWTSLLVGAGALGLELLRHAIR